MQSIRVMTLAACCLLLAQSVAAQPTVRGDPLQMLSSVEVMDRRLAVKRLGEVGEMGDAKALVDALRDSDRIVRIMAEQALWAIWGRSGDAETDRLYARGVRLLEHGRLPEAIEIFSRIVAHRPQFAEGWNKRATAYFLAGDYRRSLADCDEVLRRNPWHFGALAGYGQIYLRLERPEDSLRYFRRALEVNPNLDSVREAMETLEELALERRRKMI